jgi:apolipoprotein D and lipocalin family protein
VDASGGAGNAAAGLAEEVSMSTTSLTGSWRRILAAALLTWLPIAVGCTRIPSGLTAVKGFEVERYMGRWYEIARLDHRFERGLSNVTAEYALRVDGSVAVTNRGYDAESGSWQEVQGVAHLLGDGDVGSLKVSFFWPFYAGYHIIALDHTGYQYAMVAGSSRRYLWVLSRTTDMDPATVRDLLKRASEWGFDTDELILVDHGGRGA